MNTYSEKFKDFVKICAENKQFVGFGNPSSKILIIGKEASSDDGNFLNNATDWNDIIENKGAVKPSFNPLDAWKGNLVKGTSDTWKKYQKLHDVIMKGTINTDRSKKLSFQSDFFVTEMNQKPSKKTAEAQNENEFKGSLDFRKKTIINHEYIKSFPVVVLACSNYITGNEIESIFNVRFKEEFDKWNNKRNRFWTHFNDNSERLVIHTRQLSMNVADKMLEEMGGVIRFHLNK